MMFALSDLRDPVAFLNGARVPLSIAVRCPFVRIEWVGNTMIGLSSERHALDWDHLVPTALNMHATALDLADPDVARWVDRKIAAVLNGRDVPTIQFHMVMQRDPACEGRFGIAGLDLDGSSYLALITAFPQAWRKHAVSAVAQIKPTRANIPAARAALVRALFGKETP